MSWRGKGSGSVNRHYVQTCPNGYIGESDNPNPPYSGRWRAFNAAALRRRAFAGRGYLYTIQRESDSAIKIGMSTNPLARFIGFRCSYNARHDRYRLIWIVKVAEMHPTERLVHDFLRPVRIGGEWFNITEDYALEIFKALGSPVFIGRPYETPKESSRYSFDG